MRDKLQLAIGPSNTHRDVSSFGVETYSEGDSMSFPFKKKRGPGYTRKMPGGKKKKR
jgi:hypothetical protein